MLLNVISVLTVFCFYRLILMAHYPKIIFQGYCFRMNCNLFSTQCLMGVLEYMFAAEFYFSTLFLVLYSVFQ